MNRATRQRCRPDERRCRQSGAAILLLLLAICLPGCQQPKRSFRLPPGCLPVRYEAATTYSSCLVASVAMAANYVLNDRKFSEGQIRSDLKRLGYDETRVGDLQAYLRGEPGGLHLVALAGELDDNPPIGLKYWLEQRGYPVICVINRDPRSDPAFNHAVVVIGICTNPNGCSADIIHYLDPSSAAQLHSATADEFEVLWASGEHAMMVVCQKPR